MQRIRLFILGIALPAFLLGACSSSKPTENPSQTIIPPVESSSDTVGSSPSDMLANETSPNDSSATSSKDEAKPEAQEADPFAELEAAKAEEDKAAAAANDLTIEENKSAEASAEPATDLGGDKSTLATYTVQQGDTLMKIAFHLYGDIDRWKDLSDWNKDKLHNANRLKPGMTLNYESAGENFKPEEYAHSYLIKKGDTLAKIADEVYGRAKKYKKLQGYNAKLIKNPNVIFAGFSLFYDITQQEMAEADARRQQREQQQPQVAKGPDAVQTEVMPGMQQAKGLPQEAIQAPAPERVAAPVTANAEPAVPSALSGPGVHAPAPQAVAVKPSAPAAPVENKTPASAVAPAPDGAAAK